MSEVQWPDEAVLVAIERTDGLLVPRGDVQLAPGDRVSIFATPAASMSVEALLGELSEEKGTSADHDGQMVAESAT